MKKEIDPIAVNSAFSCADSLSEKKMLVPPHSDDVQKNKLAERAFLAQIRNSQGTNPDKLQDWLDLARNLSEADMDDGEYDNEYYRWMLQEYGEAFEQIEQSYEGVAAAMFNHRAGYLPGEMLPAAEWISNGGSPEKAIEMARNGAFEGGSAPSHAQAEGSAMDMRL